MNLLTLRTISQLRRVNQSDLAKMADISRQAVSHWFKAPAGSEVSVWTPHLRRLSEALHVRAEDLLHPLPILGETESIRHYEAALLWDNLYPGLVEFSVALVWGEAPALARLVQIFGLYKSSKIVGRKIWKRFPDYKKNIRPVRREQLERVWQLYQNPI